MVLDTDTIFPVARDGADEFFVQEAEKALRPRLVTKAVDQSVTNDATVNNDDELFMSLSAEQTYEFELMFDTLEESGGQNIKITFVGPTGATGRYWTTVEADNLNTTLEMVNLGTDFNISATTVQRTNVVRGWIKTASTTGNLQFKWAQQTSDAQFTKVMAGSWLKVTRQ